MIDVSLRTGRERSVRRRHPWVMSGSVAEVAGAGSPGEWARVISASGEVLGFGHYSPASSIRVRVLHFGAHDPGEELLDARIAGAVARRGQDPLLGETDGVRLVNAEGDGLPGLAVDRYADACVVKLTSAGMLARREQIVSAVREATGASIGYERADGAAARREGVPSRQGALWGEPPGGPLTIRERGRRFDVDIIEGQKTGFYLDQRDSRDLVAQLATDARVLDLFCYTGGFAVAAARAGARSVTLVDSSPVALQRAAEQLKHNAAECEVQIDRADAFEYLRKPRAEGRSEPAGGAAEYDLLIVDPPPLARHARDVAKATRAYKDLLLHAFRRAAPGGRVLAFACSHHVDAQLFQKVAFGASLDARRGVQILRSLGAPSDHPVSIDHPEGRYLSGLLLQVDDAEKSESGA